METENKTVGYHYKCTPKTQLLLKKLSRLHFRPISGVIEYLIYEEGKKYGLIEAREVKND